MTAQLTQNDEHKTRAELLADLFTTRQKISILEQSLDSTHEQDHYFKESVALHNEIYKHAPIGLCYFNIELEYIQINGWLARINGLSIEQHLGHKLQDVLPLVADGVALQLKQVISNNEPILCGIAYIETPAHIGEKRYYEHNYYPHCTENGDVIGVSCVIQDITVRKLSEDKIEKLNKDLELGIEELRLSNKELAQSQSDLLTNERLAVIGQLAATVSHELRNPLGSIQNAAFYLKSQVPKDAEHWSTFLNIIEEEVFVADRIIQDLLHATRTSQPIKEHLSLVALFNESYAASMVPQTINCTIKEKCNGLQIFADKSQLRQVFINLITNALQAMEGVGEISLDIIKIPGNVGLSIIDNGPGVHSSIQNQIFEALFTTKSKGTGLGLWISSEIIRRHGGSLTLANNSCQGATFTIVLPNFDK